MIEYLSIKVSQQFIEYLYKNGLESSSIKISYYNSVKYNYGNFSTRSDFIFYVQSNYKSVDYCKTGSFVKINSLVLSSTIYGIVTKFIINDICNTVSITKYFDRDVQRNATYLSQCERQESWIRETLTKYCTELGKINKVYITGIYSPCYAEPGYSEGTGQLIALRNSINTTNIFI